MVGIALYSVSKNRKCIKGMRFIKEKIPVKIKKTSCWLNSGYFDLLPVGKEKLKQIK